MGAPANALALAALPLALWAIACGPEPDPPPPPPPPPPTLSVEIGTGAAGGTPGFVPMADGAELELEPGSQGGFHVYINLKLPPDLIPAVTDHPYVIRRAARSDTGEVVSRATQRVNLIEAGGTWSTENSMRLFLCPTPIGISVADELLELEVQVSPDPSGADPQRGQIRFTPRCPEGDQNAFCLRICFG